MSQSSSGGTEAKPADRRSFLKIGVGVVAGAVVAGAGVAAYEGSVIGSNNSSSSSTVASLNSELADTQSQLTATQGSLTATQNSLAAANSTIGNLNSQLSATQSALGNAQSSLTAANNQNASLTSQNSSLSSQNANLSSQLTATQGSLSSANAQVQSLQGQVSTQSSQISSLNSNLTATQDLIDERVAFLSLNNSEQSLLAAICNSIIPTDSNGPGANQTGAVYFIDRQLRATYGTSGNVYRMPPYIPANVTTPVTVDGITYPGGSVTYVNGSNTFTVKYNPTANVRVGAGSRWQYPFDMKEFWTIGLAGTQLYANAAYGGDFETLSAANQTQCLTDLWNNKPTFDGANAAITGGAASGYQEIVAGVNGHTAGTGGTQFGAVLPSDFAYELFFMVWNGFWMDPAYGGNWGMLGWTYQGWHAANFGNFYNEGYTSQQIMVLNKPLTLQPASIGQFQKGSA